ncbi:ATP-dependent zinc metalloprotease FtsH [bioreactor metagenome]|uniref:ATP-dependent zinc metalloprotease FtsH n=1 Tax=bioreactor metagenome TaxID=1076179 RepID=A0A644ZQ34_9ZZZZ
MIDPALLRPGRFDMLLEFSPPDETQRAEIFKIHLRGKPAADDVDPKTLARMTEGATGADIMRICESAALLALTDYIGKGKNADSSEPKMIRMIDFQNAIESR